MWTRFLFLATWAAVLNGPLSVAPSHAAEAPPHPLLEKARARIQAVLAVQMPQAQVTVAGNRLTAEYHVRPYQVYPAPFADDLPEQPVTRRGPAKDGLLLTLEISPAPPEGADRPAFGYDLYYPYWQTAVDRYPLRDRTLELSLILLSGSRVPARLLEQLRAATTAELPPAPLEWKSPALRKVAARVEALLHSQYPEARLRATPDGLYVECHVRTFQVHGRFLTGETQREAGPELGPEVDGLLLGITLRAGPYQGMAVVPQDHVEPYWTTHLDALPLPASNEHLFLVLSYGSRTDKDLIRKLKEAVNGE